MIMPTVRPSTGIKLSLSVPLFWWWYKAAYRDDQKFTLEDIDETLGLGVGLTLLWSEELVTAGAVVTGLPVAAMAGAASATVAAGFVPAYVIGGKEGVENYGDFVYSGPSGMVEKTMEVTVPVLKQEIAKTERGAKTYLGVYAKAAERKAEKFLRRRGLPEPFRLW
jgi:hypothetical protein